MIEPTLNRASRFSIVWAMVLAILTIVEWSSLGRDPMSEQIFLPFIEREITVPLTNENATGQIGTSAGDLPGTNAPRNLQTNVEISFNGPLFLAYFFGPILIIQAIGLLSRQLRHGT